MDRIACAGSPSLSHLFRGWCNGVMDSARDFGLLGESVPQVRVLARTLALLEFFKFFISSDSLLSEKKNKKIYMYMPH